MKTLLIYGATGYTGHMTAAQAKSASLNIILAGRNRQRLGVFAGELDVSMRVFGLEDAGGIAHAQLRKLPGLTGRATDLWR